MIINIAIADDHPMIVDGLQHILMGHKHIVLQDVYATGAELLEGLRVKQPDVLLLDIRFPDKNGDQLISLIKKQYKKLAVLVLTSIDSAFYIYSMLQSGAAGYVLKNSHSIDIVKAIECVYKGERFLEQELKEKLDRYASKIKNKKALRPDLTAKEKEVLLLTVKGNTVAEISEQIFIGQRTVEYYRSNLLLKLEVRNLAELIRKSLELGLIDGV